MGGTPRSRDEIIRCVVEEFRSRFAPGGALLFVRSSGPARVDAAGLAAFGVSDEATLPDVVIHDEAARRVILVSVMGGGGPITEARRAEIDAVFAEADVERVYVTAFADRRAMRGALAELAWGTVAWVAEEAAHAIHFDGQRLLGPY